MSQPPPVLALRQVCQPAQREIRCTMLHNLRKEEQFCSSGLWQPESITDFLHAAFNCLVPQFPHGERVTRTDADPTSKGRLNSPPPSHVEDVVGEVCGTGLWTQTRTAQRHQFFPALCILQREHATWLWQFISLWPALGM